MDEKPKAEVGIKETKEVLVGLNEVALVLCERLKDGLQIGSDVSAVVEKVLGDADFRAKVVAAAEGIAAVPSEIKDLAIGEIIELATVQIGYVPKIVDALKK